MGIDWPEIACISYCRPTKSEMRFVQNIGRGLRKSPGKDDLLILDHSDTHLRLGFVTDIVHSTLHNGREAPEAPAQVKLPKNCPKCNYLKAYGIRKCPNCGFETAAPPPIKEYTAAGLAQFNGKKKRGKTESFTMEEKAIFLAELKGYARSHNYKEGWAAQKFRARFEVWPDWSIKGVPAREIVSAATMTWIKSQQIAWAKSKRRSEQFAWGTRKEVMPEAPVQAKVEQTALVPGTLMTQQDMEDFR
jgi:hypothetical protein